MYMEGGSWLELSDTLSVSWWKPEAGFLSVMQVVKSYTEDPPSPVKTLFTGVSLPVESEEREDLPYTLCGRPDQFLVNDAGTCF
jgi:hypothetical protein